MRLATVAIHASDEHSSNGPIAEPIQLSTTYSWDSFEQTPHWIYSRYSNPNRGSLEITLAALEGAKRATAFASGTAAITASMQLAAPGGHVLIAEEVYGGTLSLARSILQLQGIEHSCFSALHPASLEAVATPATKVLIFESPTNPTLRIADIGAIVEIAKRHGILTIFDNTFATPILQNPLSFGIDIVCHSSTKYLSGHSDVLGGLAATNSEEIHGRLSSIAQLAGSSAGPFDCWLVRRGLKSLAARMRNHCEGAMAVARFLEKHPRVRKVNYPGLESHEGHELAKKQMRDFGGMLSFEIDGGAREAIAFGKNCRIFKMAASLGGVESLISYPPQLSHAALTSDERLARGIPDTLLRLSIGLEDPRDLIEDLKSALDS